MNSLSLLIAWRYVRGAHYEKNIASMVKVCFLGILISSFSLALVIAVMNGFEKATHAAMQGIHAPIIMRAGGNPLDYHVLSAVLQQEFQDIQALSPASMRQAIIQPIDSDDITNVIVLKAVDPEMESKVTGINKKMTHFKHDPHAFTAAISANNIVIGEKLAKALKINVGDTVNILFTQDEQARNRKITLDQATATVSGFFATGIDEFDASLAFCSFAFFDSMFANMGVTQINIKLSDNADEAAIIEALKKRTHLEVYSWKELYPALVSALKLEKYAMFLILALITLIASMNIVSLLFMQITQKRGDIAILKSMGMNEKDISSIFLYMGLGITITASALGLMLACIASWLLEHYPIITLPDAYYVSHLPAHMELHLVALIFAVIIVLSMLATCIPARRTRLINIAEILRFEA